MPKTSFRCYCAFCRTERSVYRKKHVSVTDAFLALLAGLLLGQIIWQNFDPRAVVFSALGLGLAELFIAFRWRLSIACPHCGFDPVLYKRKPQLAADRVREHFQRRREDPLSVFTPPPKLPVLIRRRSREEEASR